MKWSASSNPRKSSTSSSMDLALVRNKTNSVPAVSKAHNPGEILANHSETADSSPKVKAWRTTRSPQVRNSCTNSISNSTSTFARSSNRILDGRISKSSSVVPMSQVKVNIRLLTSCTSTAHRIATTPPQPTASTEQTQISLCSVSPRISNTSPFSEKKWNSHLQ